MLRDYQSEISNNFDRLVAGGVRSVLVTVPNDLGEAVIASVIVAKTVAAGQRVLVLAHRREIIDQTISKLHDSAIEFGVMQAGLADEAVAAVQVASIQTLHARDIRTSRLPPRAADLIVPSVPDARGHHGYG